MKLKHYHHHPLSFELLSKRRVLLCCATSHHGSYLNIYRTARVKGVIYPVQGDVDVRHRVQQFHQKARRWLLHGVCVTSLDPSFLTLILTPNCTPQTHTDTTPKTDARTHFRFPRMLLLLLASQQLSFSRFSNGVGDPDHNMDTHLAWLSFLRRRIAPNLHRKWDFFSFIDFHL